MIQHYDRPLWRLALSIVTLLLVAIIGTSELARAQESAKSRANEQITFTRDVAPILQRSFQNCHRPGSIDRPGDHGSNQRRVHILSKGIHSQARDKCRDGRDQGHRYSAGWTMSGRTHTTG